MGTALQEAVQDGLCEVGIMQHLARAARGLLGVTIMGRCLR